VMRFEVETPDDLLCRHDYRSTATAAGLSLFALARATRLLGLLRLAWSLEVRLQWLGIHHSISPLFRRSPEHHAAFMLG
jgi:hypothetical protein